jgi:hypothetical protein
MRSPGALPYGSPVTEVNMLIRRQKILLPLVIAGMFAARVTLRTTIASGQASSPDAQNITPQSPKVAAGEIEAKKLLLLMDADKNGRSPGRSL